MSTTRPGRDAARERLRDRPHDQTRDVVRWLALAAVGGLIALLADGRADGVGAILPTDRYGALAPTLDALTLLAPAVAVVVLVAIGAGLVDRLPWWPLQIAAWIAAAAWAAALGLADGGEAAADAVSGPDGTTAADGQAPGARLLLRWLGPLADASPELLVVVLAVGSALAVPFVSAAVHSLCGQVQARRLMPVLVLAPYAAWASTGVGGLVTTLCAAMLALGVMSGERGRGLRWQLPLAVASGLLLGFAALAWYGALILAVSLLSVYFVRRRALLIPLTAVAMLIPLWIAALAGYSWVDGFALAVPWSAGDTGRLVVLLAVDLTALLIVCGPAYVASMRKLRNTPGWPFLAGATAGLVFWAVTGLPATAPPDAWLPYLPWLLVAAVAPRRQAGKPVPVPVLLVAAGAVVAVVLRILFQPG